MKKGFIHEVIFYPERIGRVRYANTWGKSHPGRRGSRAEARRWEQWVSGLKEVVVFGAEGEEGTVAAVEDRLQGGCGGHVVWALGSHCNAFRLQSGEWSAVWRMKGKVKHQARIQRRGDGGLDYLAMW